MFNLKDFIRESNRIEGIHREPTKIELGAYEKFLSWKEITINRLENFVMEICGAELRSKRGMNVYVGNHTPRKGGPEVVMYLQEILEDMTSLKDSWYTHMEYETLYPFMDGNGRSGRALWLWMEKQAPIGFLHKFYYQNLQNYGGMP